MAKSKYTEETKLAVVLEGLKNSSSIAELCRKHGISDALYYRWRDQFVEGGREARFVWEGWERGRGVEAEDGGVREGYRAVDGVNVRLKVAGSFRRMGCQSAGA